jgi:hypothetical protein
LTKETQTATVTAPPSTNHQAWTITSTLAKRSPAKETENPSKVTKLGTNMYKIAAAAQEQRMDKLEAAIKAIGKASILYKDNPRITTLEQNIALIAQSQCNTTDAIKQVIKVKGETKAFVKELTGKVRYNKKQADEDHRALY